MVFSGRYVLLFLVELLLIQICIQGANGGGGGDEKGAGTRVSHIHDVIIFMRDHNWGQPQSVINEILQYHDLFHRDVQRQIEEFLRSKAVPDHNKGYKKVILEDNTMNLRHWAVIQYLMSKHLKDGTKNSDITFDEQKALELAHTDMSNPNGETCSTLRWKTNNEVDKNTLILRSFMKTNYLVKASYTILPEVGCN